MTDQKTDRPGLPRTALAILIAAVIAVAGMAVGASLNRSGGTRTAPVEGSAEAGFARDMKTHHLQAVEMSVMVREASDDPAVRSLALDIMLTQQQQAGQMYGWLELWGLPQTTADPPMQWMSDDPAGMGSMEPSGSVAQESASGTAMPGMATEEDLRRLDRAEGREAEVIYLDLMIAHHQGGVAMAQAALLQTDDDAVRRLAQAIVDSQTAELTVLRTMLAERGGEPDA